jgi:hypothetical protein
MQPERPSTRRFGLIVAVVVVAIIAGGVLWLANAVRTARAETREYREQHSEAKIVGKTADEIIAMFGEPYAAERGSDGKAVFIMYKQVKHGQYCGIALKDGVAVNVSFSFQ